MAQKSAEKGNLFSLKTNFTQLILAIQNVFISLYSWCLEFSYGSYCMLGIILGQHWSIELSDNGTVLYLYPIQRAVVCHVSIESLRCGSCS